jgi:hypothetical protein
MMPRAQETAKRINELATDCIEKMNRAVERAECHIYYDSSTIEPYLLAPEISYTILHEYELTEFSRSTTLKEKERLADIFARYRERLGRAIDKNGGPLIKRYKKLHSQLLSQTIADLQYDAKTARRYLLKIADRTSDTIITARIDFTKNPDTDTQKEKFHLSADVIHKALLEAKENNANLCLVHNPSIYITGDSILEHAKEMLRRNYLDYYIDKTPKTESTSGWIITMTPLHSKIIDKMVRQCYERSRSRKKPDMVH